MIPKIIHIIWIGPNKLPYREYRRSWEKHNPDWELNFVTDKTLPELINAKEYHMMPTYAGKADVLRLELLYQHGGVYSDADSQCLRPLAPLLEGVECFGMTNAYGNVANSTLGCTPGHPAFKQLVEGLPAHIERLRKQSAAEGPASIHEVAGGKYITPVLQADPTFVQMDGGQKKGARELITGTEERTDRTFIVHYAAKSWTKVKGGKWFQV